jgi:hypothetical protein
MRSGLKVLVFLESGVPHLCEKGYILWRQGRSCAFCVIKGEMMKRFTCYSIDLLFEGDTGF